MGWVELGDGRFNGGTMGSDGLDEGGSNLEAQSRHSEAKTHRLNLGILRLKSQRLNYRRSISAIEVRRRPTVHLFLSK